MHDGNTAALNQYEIREDQNAWQENLFEQLKHDALKRFKTNPEELIERLPEYEQMEMLCEIHKLTYSNHTNCGTVVEINHLFHEKAFREAEIIANENLAEEIEDRS